MPTPLDGGGHRRRDGEPGDPLAPHVSLLQVPGECPAGSAAAEEPQRELAMSERAPHDREGAAIDWLHPQRLKRPGRRAWADDDAGQLPKDAEQPLLRTPR